MMTLPHAIVLTGKYRHGTGRFFAGRLGAALSGCGCEVTQLDLLDRAQAAMARQRAFYRGAELALTVNSYRPDTRRDGFRYLKETGCVMVSWLTQAPFVRFSRTITNNDLLICRDRSHLEGLRKYYRLPSATAFLPPGGEPPSVQIPWTRRRYDLVYVGDYDDPDRAYRRFQDYPDRLRRLLEDAVALADQDLTVDAWGALLRLMLERGLDPLADPDLAECLLIMFEPFDRFLKARRRLAALRMLDEAGISCQLWGDGYPDGLFRVHVPHPARPWEEIGPILARTRMVLDLSFMSDGGDERLFAALCGGAAVVTLNNPLVRDMFAPGRDVITFARLDELPERCAAPASETTAAVAAAGLARGLAAHTWDIRARQLRQLVAGVRQACRTSG